jgi:DNA (cytosine-5)-methyltransferase 1
MVKYFSMFSGIGGFEKGIEQAYGLSNNEYAYISKEPEQEERPQGRERPTDQQGVLLHPANRATPLCIGYSEIDKYAIATYQSHFGGHTNYGDATKINARELPDFDLLVGGFPCQAFSVAGKRKGFDDTRGTLFFDIARILSEKRPRHLVLENVKGLLSHDSGKTFQTIIGVLTDLGYFVEWQVLNSKDFGVPQNRERVFIVGHLGGEPRRKVFPIRQDDRLYFATSPTDEPRPQAQLSTTVRVGMATKADSTFVQGTRIRRLTPLECERLQGFPDNWTVGSDTQRYKQCGNAVTVNVVEAVMRGLYET